MTAWRETARQPDIFGIDARVTYLAAIWALHWAWWTFYLAAAAIVMAIALQVAGYRPDVAVRRLKLVFIGTYRPVPRERPRLWRWRMRQ